MARRRARSAQTLLAALALALLAGHVAARPALDGVRARLAGLENALEDPASRTLSARALLRDHGLDALADGLAAEAPRHETAGPGPSGAQPGQAQAGIEDFRVALALLSQGYSTEDDADVLAAQGPHGPVALTFRGGTVTLADIRDAASRLVPDRAMRGDTLRLPLVLWADTRLVLAPGERLALGGADGAFILSLGRVEVDGAEIVADRARNPHSPEFVPFLAVAGGGALRMREASVDGLGFGWTDKYAGVSVLGHPFMPSQGITRIVRSRFESVVSLVIAGSDGAWLSDNRFHNVRDNALRLSRAPDAVVSGNLFSGTAPTNAIRLLDRSDDVRLTGNVLLGGRRAGILVASGSDGAVLAGNVIWARAGGAIKFLRAACGRAERNIVLDGAQKGIEVRASPGTAVRGNLIGGNHSSAIWISDQPQDALTRVEGNIIAGNGAGLATATAARIRLARNDFSAQLPRLVQGDILAQNRTLLADLAGATPIILTSAAATPARTPVATGCPGRGLR